MGLGLLEVRVAHRYNSATMSLSDSDKSSEVLFKERQTFRLGWLRVPLAVLSAFLIALSLYIIFGQFFQNTPAVGATPDGGVIVIVIIMLVVGIGLPAVIFRAELLVTVDPKALTISFAPFVRRTIPILSIIYCEPYIIAPVREYIGVGILVSLRGAGIAYSVSGNEGVQIELDNGTRLFVGSQYPEELAKAVATARSL
jgi:hypothetical protein